MTATLPSLSQPPQERALCLLKLLAQHSQGDYIGEPISQLAHSLQCAHLASQSHSSPATIVGALLHDVGQFLPHSLLRASMADDTAVGRPNHATTGAKYLESLGFPKHTVNVVAQHVAAKRYLCATDPQYAQQLSEASKASLRQQGGPMGEDEMDQWKKMEGWRECVEVRRWDDMAKVEGIEDKTPGLEAYVDMVAGVLEQPEP